MKKFSIVLAIGFVVLTTILLSFLIFAYVNKFGVPLQSDDPSNWRDFSAYFGDLMGLGIAFLNLVVLIWLTLAISAGDQRSKARELLFQKTMMLNSLRHEAMNEISHELDYDLILSKDHEADAVRVNRFIQSIPLTMAHLFPWIYSDSATIELSETNKSVLIYHIRKRLYDRDLDFEKYQEDFLKYCTAKNIFVARVQQFIVEELEKA